MKNLKVLHVISNMDPKMGGVCQALRTIIPELESLGVYNEVVSLDSPYATFIKDDLFIINALGPGKKSWGYSSALIPWLLKNIIRFDSIILHGLWQFPGYAIEKTIRKLKKRANSGHIPRLLVMPHGMLDPYFQKAKGRELKAIRNWVYWKLIEQHVINKADGLLFTCESELELARIPFNPYTPQKETVVGLGIKEPPIFDTTMRSAFFEKCPGLQGHSYFLFLSRIHEKKGVDLLIKAYASIANSGMLDAGCTPIPKLVIAGPGLETDFGKKMKSLALSLQPENIFFSGMLTKESKWGAFYGCESFILPSHQENFGIAVAEALACSRPVIISNQVNIWREIEESGAGIVMEDTYEMIHEALRNWLVLADDLKQEMSKKARTVYERKFTIEGNVSRLKKALENS